MLFQTGLPNKLINTPGLERRDVLPAHDAGKEADKDALARSLMIEPKFAKDTKGDC
jgi:hypothetical protein